MIQSFTKIFSIGTNYIRDIFNEEVEITEKIDGSQFVFGKIKDEIYVRSKGATLYFDNPDKMFKLAIDYVQSIRDFIPEGMVFYCEYLNKSKHNTLKYDRVPTNNLILFGVMDTSLKFYPDIKTWAEHLKIESIPILYKGKINNPNELTAMLDRESVLGGCKIEGVVVKNYERQFLLGGQPMPLMAGKYVSEAFKEVHQKRWGSEEKTANKFEMFKQGFRTEARWAKGVQHLAEKGEIENSPKDIGKLIKEIQNDIIAEEEVNIKQWLWNEYKGDVLRCAVGGFPEWYKKQLLERSFEGKEG